MTKEPRAGGDNAWGQAFHWDTALDAMSAFVSIHDADYTIARVNRALAVFLRKAPEELIGRKCYEIMHGASQPPARCPHKRALQERSHQIEEFSEPHLGITILVSVTPVLDVDGQPVCSAHVALDITRTIRRPISRNGAGELSVRQKKILELYCLGKTTKAIAGELGVSRKTVEYHKYQMMRKLSVRSFHELIAKLSSVPPE